MQLTSSLCLNSIEDASLRGHSSYDTLHKLQPSAEAPAKNFKCEYEPSSHESVNDYYQGLVKFQTIHT
jgi:hypothetical protein